MIFKRITSPGIAHHSYFIGSKNYAAIIDPRRDCRIYVETAERASLKIRYILETHRNEDYLTGSLDLSKLTGAAIFHGSGIDWKYGNLIGDGEEVEFDNIKLTAIKTPGHTPESTSFLLTDLNFGAEIMVFTGDTLFVGEVGRTDLQGPAQTARAAGQLYHSIFERLLPLGDEIIICPAHGSGSVCGDKIAARDESTLGIERHFNPRLQKNRDDFISYKIEEKLEIPPYFERMEQFNLVGPPLLNHTPKMEPITPSELVCEMGNGAIIVDTRQPYSFYGAHIKNSYSIWMNGLPSFAGWVLPYDRPLVLIVEETSQIIDCLGYLIRLGYDRIKGYLKNGMEEWSARGFPIQTLGVLSVHELKSKISRSKDLIVLDVRSYDEWNFGHIAGAIHFYAGHIKEHLKDIPADKPIAVICSVGNRASLAASILLRSGYDRVFNVIGGMQGWVAAGLPTVTE